MKKCTIKIICCMMLLAAGMVGAASAFAEEVMPVDETKKLEEMPVLTGQEWQVMDQDSKLSFIWGIGHVVTVEQHVVQRHPELQRADFVAKLGEGLRGIPMRDIVQKINNFYTSNPANLNLPVMRVIWGQIVKPRLSSGIADKPITREDEERQK